MAGKTISKAKKMLLREKADRRLAEKMLMKYKKSGEALSDADRRLLMEKFLPGRDFPLVRNRNDGGKSKNIRVF